MISDQPGGGQLASKRVAVQDCHELFNCWFVATVDWYKKIVFFIAQWQKP
jgi:hypothetical protein